MQWGLRLTYKMSAGEPGSEWPLFACVVLASSSRGADGQAESLPCPPGPAVPFRGAGAVGGAPRALQHPGVGSVVGPGQTGLLGLAGLGRMQGSWGEVGRGWAGQESVWQRKTPVENSAVRACKVRAGCSQCRARRHGEGSKAPKGQKRGAKPVPSSLDTPGKLSQGNFP